jgi:lipase (class 3)
MIVENDGVHVPTNVHGDRLARSTRVSFTAEQKEALCLSAITYRNFAWGGGGWIHGKDLHSAIAAGLDNVPLTRGHWDLAWGPVAYRAPLSLVDDALMYVVRRRDEPRRHVVVIRGTNPVSLFDWVFGDFWVTAQMPWPYGGASPSAKISLSTALGLGLLQSMHSPPPPRGLAEELWDALDGGIGGVLRKAGDRLVAGIGAVANPALTALREEITPFTDRLIAARRARAKLLESNPVAAVLAGWEDSRQRDVLREVTRITNVLTERYSGVAFALLGATTAHPAPGATLLEYLREAGDRSNGNLDVLVTGHSKGGALASTVALWLADTQGTAGVAEHDQWDPAGTATVRCHSFAGPTAGNAAFAAHSNAKIGRVCARILNTNDIVPHAWAIEDVAKIPGLWKLAVGDDAIDRLADQIGRDLTTLELGYTHPDQRMPFTVPSPNGCVEFLQLLAYHHFVAYFVGMDIADQVDPIGVVVSP